MAGLTTDANGTRRVTFRWRGKRGAIRIGHMPDRAAETFQMHVGAIVAARDAGVPLEPLTVTWLAGLSDDLHARVAATGLVDGRQAKRTHTLGELLDEFYGALEVKPATKVTMEQTRPGLEAHLGRDRDVATITPKDLDAWRARMVADELAPATIAKRCKVARQIFARAQRWGMLAETPAGDLRTGAMTNPSRQVFVDRPTIARVLDAAPDAEWRLLIALGRFGGLRVPSEALALRWEDVDFDERTIRVPIGKTGPRTVPMFAELQPLLLEVFEAAPERDARVISRYRNGQNINTQLRRIIRRAGQVEWPRTWHNLRASRATELAAEFPGHVAAAWLGHTEQIADKHYRMVRDEDFARAVAGDKCGNILETNAAMRGAARACTESPKTPQAPGNPRLVQSGAVSCNHPHKDLMTPRGFEPRFSG
ncbi:MAG: site-specific integrase [Leptolyngbya sp. PLA3]|nr:MAG: site-specific integrase [Cyanobacteria bacterium CYA]MCE7969200.1 site-specific integrase [Leptolyngbya sp. PL-A3]